MAKRQAKPQTNSGKKPRSTARKSKKDAASPTSPESPNGPALWKEASLSREMDPDWMTSARRAAEYIAEQNAETGAFAYPWRGDSIAALGIKSNRDDPMLAITCTYAMYALQCTAGVEVLGFNVSGVAANGSVAFAGVVRISSEWTYDAIQQRFFNDCRHFFQMWGKLGEAERLLLEGSFPSPPPVTAETDNASPEQTAATWMPPITNT